MNKRLVCAVMALMMMGSCAVMTACGGSSESTDAEQATEETVQAADPMTDEEKEADDSDGCIEDSEDLLY